MRDQMERLLVLPFSLGCVSKCSTAVSCSHSKKPTTSDSSNPTAIDRVEEERPGNMRLKSSLPSLALPKPNINISGGIHKLVRSLKNFSHLFVYKEAMEEMEMQMEIGFPTEVKHVTHIGWDGSATTNPTKGWDSIKAPDIVSLTTISMRQFELAMAGYSDSPAPQMLDGSSKPLRE